jgi:hypothetical protein
LSPQAKGKSSSAASSPRTTTRSRAEKKVYSLAVQKFDPPEETVSLRILYDSLSKQIVMAEFWYCDFLLRNLGNNGINQFSDISLKQVTSM